MKIFVDYEKDEEEIAVSLEVDSEKEAKILNDLFNVEERIANQNDGMMQLTDKEYNSLLRKKGYEAYLAIADSGFKFKIVLPARQFF